MKTGKVCAPILDIVANESYPHGDDIVTGLGGYFDPKRFDANDMNARRHAAPHSQKPFDALIFVGRQANPWLKEGRIGLFKYFLAKH